MATPTIQHLLAEFILDYYPEAIVKKIDTDSYLDIHVPSIHPKKGTHLFFNTSKQKIKIGFYCREEEFVEQVLNTGGGLVEKYSQGVSSHRKLGQEYEVSHTVIRRIIQYHTWAHI